MPATSYYVRGQEQLNGIYVQRGAATLPATTTTTYFNVQGTVEILGLIGTVTTVIQAQADAIKWRFTPTGGTVGDVSGTVDVNALAVGAKIVVQGPTTAGAVSQAMTAVNATGGTGKTIGGGTGSILLSTGALGLNAAATNTGATSWELWYRRVTPGAAVTAA